MMSTRVRIRTASRLHFGLLGWGPESSRQFGGIGLMIEDPGITLTAEDAEAWSIEGLLAERVERTIARLREHCAVFGIRLRPTRLRIESAPAEHIGLGVGTQLALAVTCALMQMCGDASPSLSRLAQLSGRGLRSGIGLHGFISGGLIVDGGRKAISRTTNENGIPPLLSRLHFPDDWRVLIVRPSKQNGLHGQDEIRAFHELPAIERGVTDRLCRIILLEVLPAVIERDLDAFGTAIRQIQASVGASFAPAQGGLYSDLRASAIVAELSRLGFAGAGQSSWGPTLYAFSDRPEAEIMAMGAHVRSLFKLEPSSIFITRADNRGAVIETESP